MPHNPKYKTIYEHRAVAMMMLGRFLRPTETVHHKNGNTQDNRPENLEIINRRKHGVLHSPRRFPRWLICQNCGKRFRPHRSSRGKQKCCSRKCGYAIMGSNRCDSAVNTANIERVIAFRQLGWGYRQIAEELRMSLSSVWRCVATQANK